MSDSELEIRNANLQAPDGRSRHGTLRIRGGRIDSIEEGRGANRRAESFDAEGALLAPGYIDLQLNGAFGHDFTRAPESIWEVAEGLPRYGVTAFLPTLVSAPADLIARAREVLAAGPPDGFVGAVPLGLHLEGPYLAPEARGAHGADRIRPVDPEEASDWSPESGVALVTLAPEIEGALDLIRDLVGRGVVAAAGHSRADAAQARRAIEAGLRYGTHLFNAMPPLHHREPGLAGALLDSEVSVGVIADGIHLAPLTCRLAQRMLGPDRVTLVTDAMAALGMGSGDFELGTEKVTVAKDEARLADGTLAGSVLAMDAAVRNWVRDTGVPVAEALAAAARNPARVLGIEEERGVLIPGARADLVLLDKDLQVLRTWVGGREASS